MAKNKSKTIIDTIIHFIDKHNLINDGNTIVIGLSGGPDSVFLLHLLDNLHSLRNLNLITAHLDHEWRENSASDVAFCQQLSEKLNIPFEYKKLSQLGKTFKGSQEEIGRKARRFFLQNIAKKYNAQHIALGHHLQDQEETFFIRLIRGTTLSGLTCMKPIDGLYIRPLLNTQKQDLVSYLNDHTITYLTDPSNELDSFLRNRIRKHVIPALQEVDQRFDHNFLRTLENLQKADNFLDSITKKTFEDITHKKNDALYMDIKALLTQNDYLQNRLILFWLIQENVSFTPTTGLLDEIKRFLSQPGSKSHTIHETWMLIKEKNYVHISMR